MGSDLAFTKHIDNACQTTSKYGGQVLCMCKENWGNVNHVELHNIPAV